MNDAAPPRRIWLCADDYGLADGVNRAIRDLISRGRLNATSVMVVGPSIGRAEVAALQDVAASSPRCAIGLHATLTAPFRPLTMYFRPLDGGLFLPFPAMLRSGLLRRLDPELIEDELLAQLAAFKELFGRAPDFVDGHQHVQLFPQVRDAFLRAVKEAGIPFNPAFAGAYDFSKASDFSALMAEFLRELPEGGLVMCHPGFVDETLRGLDPLTTQREAEHAFLASDQFPALQAANKVTLS
jgi:predicted glycoside hydrolase/deacetylase ChbG (UPF0249 family)